MADGGWSDAQEAAILDYYFRATGTPAVASSYLALCLAPPADNSDVISEPSYTGYARQQVLAAGWDAAVGGDPSYIDNSGGIQFPLCGEDVAEVVTHWALMSAASGGTLLFSGSITVPPGGLTLNSGVQPQFDAGAVRVQLGSVAT